MGELKHAVERGRKAVSRGRLWRTSIAALRIAAILGVVYVLVLGWLMFSEERMLFPAMRYPLGDWRPAGLDVEDVHFEAGDGVRLHGWFCPIPDPAGVVLFSHGNGGNLTHRADVIRMWQEYVDVSVFIYDYRGYGRSEGSPREPGLYADVRGAYRWLTGVRGVPADQIVLHGESIGGAVALDLALESPHRALVLESSFTSAPDTAAQFYPWLPVRWLMRNRFDSLSKIGRYRGALFVAHGDRDSLVPFAMGRRLYEAAPEPKRFYAVVGADHNDLPWVGGPDYYRAIAEFLAETEHTAEP